VARDQPLAGELEVGEAFALNLLALGRETQHLRSFQRPLPLSPGLLDGLDLQESPAGQPLLSDALAWLEARVSKKVACGDHWLLVAEVLAGGVLDADGITAVPQRRSGQPA